MPERPGLGMNAPEHIAVIDIGKTNAKIVLIAGASATQIAVCTRANTVLDLPPYPHHDVEGLWSFILDGLKQLHNAHRIDGISITTHGATAALMAGSELALPVLDYEYGGPENVAAGYGDIRPDFSEILSPRLPGGLNTGAQIYWQSQEFAAEFESVTSILMYPQYWAFRLTGILANEMTSLGAHSDLWNPLEKQYSSLVTGQGWEHLFSPLRPAISVLGPVLAEVSAHTGLAESTPVTCGIHDSNASLLPHLNVLNPPFTIISSGTWTIIMNVGGATDTLDPARDSLANVDAYGHPVPTARFMGGREFDILTDGEAVEPTAAEIAQVIAQNVRILPSWVKGVGPFPDALGRWVGAADDLTPGARTAAVSLYLALMAKTGLDLAGAGDPIIIEGPFTRNELFCRALAALSGRQVHVSGDATGTSLGAAMLFEGALAPAAGLSAPVPPLNVDGFDAYCARWFEAVRGL